MQNLLFEAAGGWWRSEIQLSQILMKLVLNERYDILLYVFHSYFWFMSLIEDTGGWFWRMVEVDFVLKLWQMILFWTCLNLFVGILEWWVTHCGAPWWPTGAPLWFHLMVTHFWGTFQQSFVILWNSSWDYYYTWYYLYLSLLHYICRYKYTLKYV